MFLAHDAIVGAGNSFVAIIIPPLVSVSYHLTILSSTSNRLRLQWAGSCSADAYYGAESK